MKELLDAVEVEQVSRADENAAGLLGAIESNDLDLALHSTPKVSLDLLLDNKPLRWQYRTVNGYLLDSQGLRSETFSRRLENILGMHPVSDEPGVGEVHWPIEGHQPQSANLNGRRTLRNRGSSEAPINLRQVNIDGEKSFYLELASADTSIALDRGATRLQSDGSTLVALLRLAFPDVDLRTSKSMAIQPRGQRLTSLLSAPVLWPRTKALYVSTRLLNLINRDSASEAATRVRGALNWYSYASALWRENPSFATALLWMSLESLYGGCVSRHSCKPGHYTALDLYLETLPDRLTEKLEEYVAALSGSVEERRRGWRNPPPALLGMHARKRIGTLPWLAELQGRLETDKGADPLLLARTREVTALVVSGMPSGVRDMRELDLLLLSKVRNIAAHTGLAVLDEGLVSYLSALAAEMLRIGFEKISSTELEVVKPPSRANFKAVAKRAAESAK